LFLDLSLKHLLKNIDITPTLNLKCAKEFVKYGFLTAGKCLINNINLLAPLKKFNWINNKVSIVDDIFTLDTDTVTKNYAESLSQALPSEEVNIVLPLSGGFDSTFLAYLLRYHKNMTTITVGSAADPNNEFATAKNTTAYLKLPNIQINTTQEWIGYLPKIVDLFEGEMFDPGVFVCWAMVDYVKRAGLKNNLFITGDGSDQVLNLIFYKSTLEKQPTVDRHTRYF
jgi:asparagine synthetase B (glutamine-hydrolysing)